MERNVGIKKPVVDYRQLRFSNITSKEFRHLLWLIFWPVFGLVFYYLELGYPVDYYTPMHCKLDDLIPFCEWFFIPYVFWFFYIIGMHFYTAFYDTDTFSRMIKYICITYTSALVIYFIFPTCQYLRPIIFPRDNLLTQMIAKFYIMDTNTNVCPSIHVMGALAIMEAALYTKSIKSKAIKWAFVIVAILICFSTVFMKQHSILDMFVALPICLVAHFICYGKPLFLKSKKAALVSISCEENLSSNQ